MIGNLEPWIMQCTDSPFIEMNFNFCSTGTGGALAEKVFNGQFHRIDMAKIGLSPQGIPAINQDRQPENYLFTWQIFARQIFHCWNWCDDNHTKVDETLKRCASYFLAYIQKYLVVFKENLFGLTLLNATHIHKIKRNTNPWQKQIPAAAFWWADIDR